jgi:methionyl-tRNA synthetase
MSRFYVTAACARADLSSVRRLVAADVLARHHRMIGARVRFLVSADASVTALRERLALSNNDAIDPEADVRHQLGVKRLSPASPPSQRLRDLISSGELRIEPAAGRDEALRMVAAGHVEPDAGWHVAASSVTSLGYGSDGPNYRRWWVDTPHRVDVIDASMLRRHAVRWPAVLLSAELPLPTAILVLTSDDSAADPGELVDRFGSDAVRWSLLRGMSAVRAQAELAAGLGNLVDRVTTMVHRYRGGIPPAAAPAPPARPLADVCRAAPERVRDALGDFDFGRAAAAVWRIVEEANDYLRESRPWELARAGQDRDVDAVLAALLLACRELANQLTPFLPAAAVRIGEQCFGLSGELPPPRGLFPKQRPAVVS